MDRMIYAVVVDGLNNQLSKFLHTVFQTRFLYIIFIIIFDEDL